MASLTGFITKRLKLRVNSSKSAVARPWERKFLGFTFGRKHKQRKVAAKSLKRFKQRVRIMTRRTVGKNIKQVVSDLNTFIQSWMGYSKIAETITDFKVLDQWIRHRLRCLQWKQWGRRGYRELRKRGISVRNAWNVSKSAKGWWRISRSPVLFHAMPKRFFDSLGLLTLRDLQSI